MNIIVVVGTGSGCGKTMVVCRILRKIAGLGAVKISPRRGAGRVEWGAGEPGKDTDLYVRSGADPVARIVGPRDEAAAAWEKIRPRFAGCCGVIIEGASALDFPDERYVAFVVGDTRNDEQEDRARNIKAQADWVLTRSSPPGDPSCMKAIQLFLNGSDIE